MGPLGQYLPNWLPEDPSKNAAARQGLLAAGAALMGGRGNLGEILGGGLMAGSQGYHGAIQQQQKDQLEQAQLRLLQNKDTRDQRSNSFLMSAFGSPQGQQSSDSRIPVPDLSNVPMMSLPGQAPASSQPAVPAAPAGANGGFPMSLNQVALMKAMGMADLTDVYKMANEGFERKQGSTYLMPDGSERSYARLDAGQVQDRNGRVSNAAGFVDSTTEVEAAKAGAQERAKANYDVLDPNKFVGEDGRPLGMTRGEYVLKRRDQLPKKGDRPAGAPVGAQGPANFPTISPQEQQGRDEDRLHILRTELAAAKNPRDVVALQREIAGVTKTLGRATGAGAPRLQSPTAARAQMGAVDTNIKVGQDLNSNWITQVHNPIQAEGKAARATLGQLETLKTVNFQSGWGAEAKSGAANMLATLGVKDAARYATSAQQFQQVAMERNMTMLQSQSGPQTDGDSERAQQTFVRLANTPQANAFIADLTGANARIAAQKADYYNKALPLARDRGDMTEIDRRWSRIAPSVWADPALAKYKVK